MSSKIAEGQLGIFFEEEEPADFVGPGVAREEVATRAGTQLNHRWTHRIESTNRKKKVHGLLDESQRIYQTGGELKNFIYWKNRWVTIAEDAWRQVFGKVDWLEVIDHERNECWRIAMIKAAKNATKYNAGVGPRIGIPMDLFDVITSDNKIRQEGK